jgi:hypothetical protein
MSVVLVFFNAVYLVIELGLAFVLLKDLSYVLSYSCKLLQID